MNHGRDEMFLATVADATRLSKPKEAITRCHIKPPSASPTNNAYEQTLCGKEDPGMYVYVTLARDEQIPATEFPVCTDCAAAHIEAHYAAIGKA